MKNLFYFTFLCLTFSACESSKRDLAFYYWKSDNIKLDAELEMLKATATSKIYVKFFEVIDQNEIDCIPIDKTNFALKSNKDKGIDVNQKHVKYFDKMEVVPTVFIKNTCLLAIKKDKIAVLAGNIVQLVQQLYENNIGKIKPQKELQIDCDWTPKTKENYFELLRCIKENLKLKISCTLRLYPFKYPKLMGVPPVDKCMLMCYNLISPSGNQSRNSILDVIELKAYVKNSKKYPKPLDVALPVFSWLHHYKQDQFNGLIQTSNVDFLKTLVRDKKTLWYYAAREVEIDNHLIRPGDKIKWEKIDVNILKKAIVLIKDNVHLESNSSLAFFDLNPTFCTQFTHENITSLHNSFSR